MVGGNMHNGQGACSSHRHMGLGVWGHWQPWPQTHGVGCMGALVAMATDTWGEVYGGTGSQGHGHME